LTHTPVDLSVGDIRRQIAAEWLQIAQWAQWRKTAIILSNGTIADPSMTSSFHKMGVLMHTHDVAFCQTTLTLVMAADKKYNSGV